MQSNPVDSLIFDLDGTLWDASGTCAIAWNRSLIQSGIEDHHLNATVVRSLSGLRIENIFKQHFNFIPENKQEELLALYKVNERDLMKRYGGQLFPKVKEVLAELRKSFPLFIVSNCLTGYIENFMGFHGLRDMFTDFESSGNTGLAKSDNIQLIVNRNKLERPVYIGDTIWDFEAAQKADVPFIYAAYGFGKVDHPDRMIKEFTELKRLLPF
jgi:phosphoglycolate phosphatase